MSTSNSSESPFLARARAEQEQFARANPKLTSMPRVSAVPAILAVKPASIEADDPDDSLRMSLFSLLVQVS